MNLDRSSLFPGGINRIARETGLDGGNLYHVAHGRRGLSVKSARKLSEATGGTAPFSFYVRTQARSIKTKIDGGDRAAALRAAAEVIRELESTPGAQLAGEAGELRAAVQELTALVGTALDGTTTVVGDGILFCSPKFGRDAFGRRVPEGSGTERDAVGRAVKKSEGPVERDAFGRRM